MKTRIKLAFLGFGLCSSIICMGDTAPFNKIKSNQQVVTNECDPVFSTWKTNDFTTLVDGKITAATNGFIVSESDPLFSSWITNNTYVKTEQDPLFSSWKQDSFTSSKLVLGKNITNTLASTKNAVIGSEVNYSGINSIIINMDSDNKGLTSNPRSTFNMNDSLYIGGGSSLLPSYSTFTTDGTEKVVWGGYGVGNGASSSYGTMNKYGPRNPSNAVYNSHSSTNLWLCTAIGYYTGLVQGPVTYFSDDGDAYKDTTVFHMKGSVREVDTFIPGNVWMYGAPGSTVSGTNTCYVDPHYGTVVGNQAEAVGGWCTVALGHQAITYGAKSIAIGSCSRAPFPGCVTLGAHAGSGDTHIGSRIFLTGSPYSMALGYMSSAGNSTYDSTTNELDFDPDDIGDIAIGPWATAKWYQAIAIGKGAKALDKQSIAIGHKAKSMGDNTVNIVSGGTGLKDFYIDDVSIIDRIANEMGIISQKGEIKGSSDNIIQNVCDFMNIPTNNQHIVMYSGDGIRIRTNDYFNQIEEYENVDAVGVVTNIVINDMSLDNIIRKYSPAHEFDETSLTNKFVLRSELPIGGSSSTDESKFEAYHTTVTNQARIAEQAIMNSTNLTQIKVALTNFFNNIK